MTSAIFIKSWRQDRFFLDYCLRSIEKFATGFSETVVILPEVDRPHFEHSSFHGARVVWVDEPDDGRNYVRQQLYKLNADQYTDAELIYYIDSDCFIMGSMTPEMFAPNGKPICLIRHWADAGSAIAWKPITQKFLTFDVIFEGMACLPIIVDRRTLPLLRDYATATHKCSVEEYALKQPGNDFSEFNAVSAFSQRFTPYLYDWRIADPERDGFPRILTQKWSWDKAGVGQYADIYERILAQ